MKNFVKYIVVFLAVGFLLLEITIRLFGLVGENKPKQSIDHNIVLSPNTEGIWIRGGLAEIKSQFKINKQGFNSLINYDEPYINKNKIALIGDSYIEGFHTDVSYSVGRQLEKILDFKYIVHEYGIAGANINDYHLLYEEIIKDKNYDFIFIFISDEDLKHKKPGFMKKSKVLNNNSLKIKIYDNFKTLSYLNINHGLQKKIVTLIKNGPESLQRIHNNDISTLKAKEKYFKEINTETILQLPNDIIILYEKGLLSEDFINYFNFQYKKINHVKLPKDNGFDEHWNENGRFNCANAIAEYILQSKNN